MFDEKGRAGKGRGR